MVFFTAKKESETFRFGGLDWWSVKQQVPYWSDGVIDEKDEEQLLQLSEGKVPVVHLGKMNRSLES